MTETQSDSVLDTGDITDIENQEPKPGHDVGETRKTKLPYFEVVEPGVWEIHAQSQERLSEVFGGGSVPFAQALMVQIGNVSGKLETLGHDKNDAVALVAEIAPRDGIEAMLATQMAAVQLAIMRHSRMMADAETIAQLDIHERTFNKLSRTFTTQMEALRKHRNGGQQKMTVEHVTVNQGGQAIVGNVSKGG